MMDIQISNFLQLAFTLAVILFAAKLVGYLATRIGQPSVLGELIIGLVLGPSLLDLTHLGFITDFHMEEIVAELGEMGVLLLMFLAGLELHLSDLARNSRVSAYAGVLGVLVPVGLGWAVGSAYQMSPNQSLFLGIALGATSVSISAQVLMELKMLRSRVGLGLLGAAVFDDILVILLLSAFLALENGNGSLIDIIPVFVKMAVFLALSVAFGLLGLPRLTEKISRLSISQGTVTFTIVILLIYGIAAELLGGMAAITGTFIAGLMFSRTPQKKVIETGLHTIAYSFFVPIFFVNIGLSVKLQDIRIDTFVILFWIVMAAVVGKVIGSGLGARLGKFSWRESLQMGIGMISRGEVGLIIAKIGLDEGLLKPELFSVIIGMVLVSTLITPPLLRIAFAGSSGALDKPSKPDNLNKREAA